MATVKDVKPLADYLLIEPAEKETTLPSGIVLPDTSKEKPQEGKVLAKGPGKKDEDGTRWFDPMPEYDYTPRYTTPEAIRPVAEKFLTDHKDIFGIDITKMTYEFEGTKPGNFFLKWKTVDENGKTKELVSVTITTGGQVIVYDNDTYDLAKNGR